VVRINPSAQAGSRSVLAYLSIDNPRAADTAAGNDPAAASPVLLRQGLFAQGTLHTARTSVLAVPLTSVRIDKPVPYIQLVESDRVVHRAVRTGERGNIAGEQVVAVTGVDQPVPEGAVVLRGQAGVVREGSAVRFTAMAPAPGKPSP
jgi:multidrug efflux system membrane fusion protein